MHLSFIILTWNSEIHIRRCVNSIMENIPPALGPYEIFLIDNGSADGTRGLIREFEAKYSDVVIPILLASNTGTAYSRNIGFQRAKGKYIAVLDSDVEISRGVFEKLIPVLERDTRVGIVSPKLVYPNGNLQKSTDDFPTVISKIIRYFFLKSIERQEHLTDEPITRSVDYAISAFWLIRDKVIDAVGLLDEKIFYAPEDVDYCLRVWKKGYRVVYVPAVSSIHHAQEISRGFKINRATVEHAKGLLYFFWKHGYWLKKPVFFE